MPVLAMAGSRATHPGGACRCWLVHVRAVAHGASTHLGASEFSTPCINTNFLWRCNPCCAAMLAMQAQPKQLPEAPPASSSDPAAASTQQPQVQPSVAPAASTPAEPQATVAVSSPAAPAAAKPVVVLLDVVLEAPVLLMPLSSGSDDLLEVDLGTLQLKNLVVWEMRSEDKDRQKLLVDEMQVNTVY